MQQHPNPQKCTFETARCNMIQNHTSVCLHCYLSNLVPPRMLRAVFVLQSNNIQTHVDGVASVYFINMSRGKNIQCHTLLWDSITLPRCNNIQSHISWDRTPITCDTRYLRWCNNVLTHKPVGLDVFAPKENLYKTIQSHSFTHNNVQCVVQQRPMSICLNGILYK